MDKIITVWLVLTDLGGSVRLIETKATKEAVVRVFSNSAETIYRAAVDDDNYDVGAYLDEDLVSETREGAIQKVLTTCRHSINHWMGQIAEKVKTMENIKKL